MNQEFTVRYKTFKDYSNKRYVLWRAIRSMKRKASRLLNQDEQSELPNTGHMNHDEQSELPNAGHMNQDEQSEPPNTNHTNCDERSELTLLFKSVNGAGKVISHTSKVVYVKYITIALL